MGARRRFLLQLAVVNGLAELSNDGFQGLERSQIVVLDADPDPAAEFFDPPRYDSEGASA